MSRTSKRPHEGASDASRISPKRVTRKNERLKGAIFPVRDAALAVDTKQLPLRKRIFDAYKKKNAKNKLFYELAGVNAVKFLYGRGWKSAHLINNAFVCASTNGKTNTVELLLNTGLITGKFLNDAFEAAAGFIGGVHLERVAFLYNNRRTCLRTLGNEDNTKPIRQEEHISDDTVIKAFEKAAASGDNTYSNIRDKSEIVKLLNKEQCIPYEMICKAFVAAVYNGNTDVVGHLRDDHRFSSESMGESFASAARSNHFELMNRSMMNSAFLPRQFFQLLRRLLLLRIQT
ncbi:hypothetical protein L914_08660 [Phytophthora nicotianae]|uniref:Uncharacterized protein n=1 Tax=Phytophthora nicotianae TaxID=4792 RepID=W2ND01_PHYNI|nr:hypothetical protein L914_08660 [Phytophthora nicotianae]